MKYYLWGGLVIFIILALAGYTKTVYNYATTKERNRVAEQSLDRNAQRNKDDEAIRDLDRSGLCREFGTSRWLPEQQRCE